MPQPEYSFATEGMKTTFSVRLRGMEKQQAAIAAGACLELVDQLEGRLSRYRPDSDISRLNALRSGESLLVHQQTYDCLQLAMDAYAATAGLFDVSLGRQMISMKEGTSDASPLHGSFSIAPDHPRITCVEAGRELDLGGIGKGFALDHMAQLLLEHGVREALVSAGASTHRAAGNGSWQISMHGRSSHDWQLQKGAVSASGTAIQGQHFVHPDLQEQFHPQFLRIWVAHPMAALADAYSTACMLMTAEEVRGFLASQPEITMLACLGHDDSILVMRDDRHDALHDSTTID